MQTSGLLAFLAGIIGSRYLSEIAYRKLDDDEKLRLMDGFSRQRAYSIIPLIFVIATYWYLSGRTDIDQQFVASGYLGVLILYLIARVFFIQRKLQQLELPTEYRNMYSLSQVVSLLGVGWFFFTLF